jgi:hypothetical protein
MSLFPTAGGESVTHGWLQKSTILNVNETGHRHLEAWVTQGFVRTVKLDPRKQGRRLYNAADVSAVLAALSAGKEPKRVLGKGGAA